MLKEDFCQWLSQVSQLTAQQRERAKVELLSSGALPAELDVMPEHCPHCHTGVLKPWGRNRGLARYRCADCGKTSNPLTGTSLARLRKRELWADYAQTLTQSLPVRKAAEQCGINKNTAFLWRHRFLAQIALHQAPQVSGIVEADETFFLESFKGQRNLPRAPRKRGGKAKKRGLSEEQIAVLVVQDRSGQHADFLLPKRDAKSIGQRLHPLVSADSILCTDSAKAYLRVAKMHAIEHKAVNLSQGVRVNSSFHVQNVNAYCSRLKGWMAGFHGVATKYLPNYLGWRRLFERHQQKLNPLISMREALGMIGMQRVIQT